MSEKAQTFPATLEGLSAATGFLREALEGSGCAGRSLAALMVAMDEISSNIVNHSGASGFELSISSSGDSVRIVFSDDGKAFDPLEKDDPDITLSAEERQIGGLGLFMVKRMMDETHYVRQGSRNVLTIVKKKD